MKPYNAITECGCVSGFTKLNCGPFTAQVVDVAKAIINAIKDPDANGKTYALVG